jgi:hypothetical protein
MGTFRTGVQWTSWKSSQSASFNYDQVSTQRRIINAANAKGIDIVEMVGGDRQGGLCFGGGWPVDLYQNNQAQFWNELQALANFEATSLGSDVHYYLMWNEANHPCDLVDQTLDATTFVRIYNGLYAGEGVYGSIPRTRWFETAINAFADWQDWASFLDQWLAADAGMIDIAAIDHYPSTWTNEGLNPIGSDGGPLDSLINIINSRNVKGAIMEMGFSTCENGGFVHNEIRQQTWINNALPIIKSKVNAQYAVYNNRIVLLDWYTMRDNGYPAGICDPWVSLIGGLFDHGTENNFGIVRLTNVQKIGYPDLRTQAGGFPYR